MYLRYCRSSADEINPSQDRVNSIICNMPNVPSSSYPCIYASQTVPEPKRLPVRNIIVAFSMQVDLHDSSPPLRLINHLPRQHTRRPRIAFDSLLPFPLLVYPLQIAPQHDRKPNDQTVAHQDRPERRIVMRRVSLTE